MASFNSIDPNYANHNINWSYLQTPQPPDQGILNHTFNTPTHSQNHHDSTIPFSGNAPSYNHPNSGLDQLGETYSVYNVPFNQYQGHHLPTTPLRAPATPLNLYSHHEHHSHHPSRNPQPSHVQGHPSPHVIPLGMSSHTNQAHISHPHIADRPDLHTPKVTRDAKLKAATPSTRPDKENTMAVVEKGPPSKAKGVGSRRGKANRWKVGGSDKELAKLDPDVKKAAGLKVPAAKTSGKLSDQESLTFIQYVTSEDVWKSFRLKAVPVYIKMGDQLKKSVDCLTSYWTDVWEKYKACKDAEKHTGGGDGDADKVKDEDGVEEKKDGRGVKRKRGKTKVRGAKWSQEYLDAFRETQVYSMIDAVAESDESVIRSQAFSSAAPISITGSENDSDEEVEISTPPTKKKKLLKPIKSSKKNPKPVVASSSDGDLLMAALTRISDASAQRAAREAKESKVNQQLKLLTAANGWAQSTNPKVRKMGEKIFLKEMATSGIHLSDSESSVDADNEHDK